MKLDGPIWLASRSPRRQQLLTEAGFGVTVMPAGIDDGTLKPGRVDPRWWVAALAYLKARWVAEALRARNVKHGMVLGADTLCVLEDRFLGQPRDADHARWMLQTFRNADHVTMTGACLLRVDDLARFFVIDDAIVRVGSISDPQIDAYISSGDWRGKAGAYNLSERLEAAWPIQCIGDPTTVMGLPMRKLTRMLEVSAPPFESGS